TGDAVAAPLSRLLLALLGLQLALGIGAYLARFSPLWIPGGQTTMLVLPVAHRLVAGLILSATVVLAVRLHMRSVPKSIEGLRGSERVSASSATEGVRGSERVSASSATEGVRGSERVSASSATEGVRGSERVSASRAVEGVRGSEWVSASSGTEGVRGSERVSASSANEGVWGKPKGSPISK